VTGHKSAPTRRLLCGTSSIFCAPRPWWRRWFRGQPRGAEDQVFGRKSQVSGKTLAGATVARALKTGIFAFEPIVCRSTNRELGRRGKIGGDESGERNFFGRAWGGKRLKIGLREFPAAGRCCVYAAPPTGCDRA
jgi:hypothetical protein